MSSHHTPPPTPATTARIGQIWHRSDPGFDRMRAHVIWNKRLDDRHSPDAIVRCTSATEVIEAVHHAREAGLKVALRGSGHSYIAAPLRNGGLLLDLGDLAFIDIDVDRRTARVGPGVRGGDLIDVLEQHGLAFPIGHCSTVAMGGYLLSGGIGWNCGEWGPACIHVSAVELVTAKGELLVANADSNSDLLWAARGAGCGFFAAVTAYHLDLQPMPSAAWLWSAAFTIESAPKIADWLSAATAESHPAAEIMCLVGPHIKTGQPSITVRAVCVGEDDKQARDRVAAFHTLPQGAELIGEAEGKHLNFTELTRLSAMPDGKRVAADQCWAEAPMGELLLAIAHLADVPVKSSTINMVSPGGGGPIPHLPGDVAGAMSVGGGISCGIYGMWDDPAHDARHLQWVRDADVALRPYCTARYVGETDLTAAPGRVAECFSPKALRRLEALRAVHDPEGLFHTFPAT